MVIAKMWVLLAHTSPSSMKNFLRRIKLIDTLLIELPISQALFVARLHNQVLPGKAGGIIPANEKFYKGEQKYIGTVTDDGFKIRRRRKMFDFNINFSVAEGTLQEQGEKLLVETEIQGFVGVVKLILPLSFAFYGFAFLISLLPEEGSSAEGFFFPFLLVHAVFFYTIAYIIMRWGVTKMKRTLEREFFFLTKE